MWFKSILIHRAFHSQVCNILVGGGEDLVPTMPGCVCPKVKDIGPFAA